MKLHIAPPDTQMARDVLEFAQYAADTLDKTQFVVMERRTWERLMPTNAPSRDPAMQERRGPTDPLGHAVAVGAAQEPQAWQYSVRGGPWHGCSPEDVAKITAHKDDPEWAIYRVRPLYAAPPPAAEGPYWMIERGPHHGSASWWCGYKHWAGADRAVRFVRKQDAENTLAALKVAHSERLHDFNDATVTEHLDAAPPKG